MALAGFSAGSAERMELGRPGEYSGMCDASAAAPVGTNLFIAASDEDNILRVYRRDSFGAPVQSQDLNAFLEIRGKSPEADLEAAAGIGERVFWIGSHGRNRNAKERLNRCRFFATDVRLDAAGSVSILPVGKPYKNLLTDFLSDPRLSGFDLDRADDKAPKDAEGLNIEGLAAAADGGLLIGFRNPIPHGKALVVPLLNPDHVVNGERAKLGAPVLLDLDGLGIRDMVFYEGKYIIIAGSYHGGGKFKLFRWNGAQDPPVPIKVNHLNQYNPEGIIVYPDKGLREFQLVSDDGERIIDGVIGKQIKDPAKQKFRSFWVQARE